MKKIFSYISDYYTSTDKKVLVISMIIMAVFIFINYQYQLEKWLQKKLPLPQPWFSGHVLIFITAFSIPYLLYAVLNGKTYFTDSRFLILLFAAPILFALKMSLSFNFNYSSNAGWNSYWTKALHWPLLAIVIGSCLFIIYKIFNYPAPFFGLTTRNFDFVPYILMLFIMVPLIAAASTQADFLSTYPKMKSVLPVINNSSSPWLYKLIYQLGYGSDFFTIELFFRGFLVLGFISIAGKDAILPMACFYCTIHFGKPLGECISSFFGGMLLGIIVYHTRSIIGGLIIHLGIAWLMEAGGTIGTYFKK